jgi:hypothetical protein
VWVSRPQQHYHTSSSTLLTRFGPLRLLPLPEDEAAAKGSLFWQSREDPAGIAECPWYTLRPGLQHMFQQWQWHWDRCVAAQGNYFEGALPKLKSS